MNNNDINTMPNFVPISGWIPWEEAFDRRRKLIKDGTYLPKEVKCPPGRYADYKDPSKGIVSRVMAIKGLHPDLEVDAIEANSIRVKKAAAPAASGNSSIIGGVISELIPFVIVGVPLFFIYRVISFIYIFLSN